MAKLDHTLYVTKTGVKSSNQCARELGFTQNYVQSWQTRTRRGFGVLTTEEEEENYYFIVDKCGKEAGFLYAAGILSESISSKLTEKRIAKETLNYETMYLGKWAFAEGSDEKLPIPWLILDDDDGHLLLLSKYALFNMRFDSKRADWSNSELRHYLNAEFLLTAFEPLESQRFVGGKDGFITLLSKNEYEKYLKTSADRICRKYNLNALGKEAPCWWWLRSAHGSHVDCILSGGDIDCNYYRFDGGAVRPALWYRV